MNVFTLAKLQSKHLPLIPSFPIVKNALVQSHCHSPQNSPGTLSRIQNFIYLVTAPTPHKCVMLGYISLPIPSQFCIFQKQNLLQKNHSRPILTQSLFRISLNTFESAPHHGKHLFSALNIHSQICGTYLLTSLKFTPL